MLRKSPALSGLFGIYSMNSLLDLKNLFEKNGIKATYFDGARLETKKHGHWGMAFGEYRQNGEIKTRKEIDSIIKK